MFVIANFKQNLNIRDLKNYFKKWEELSKKFAPKKNLKIIFCPSTIYLDYVSKQIKKYTNTFIGIQNISPFKKGSYTGEVGANQAKDFARFCILGHSERRKYFKEDNKEIRQKVKNAIKEKVIPIVCISKKEQFLPKIKNIVYAYEPIENIGTGKAASIEKIKSFIASKPENSKILYGGSVNTHNIKKLLSIKSINGFLIGSASLKPDSFFKIVQIINNND